MSYARWSEGDVYVFHDVRGGMTCMVCTINDGKDFVTHSRQEMLDHLSDHEDVGDVVPSRAPNRIKQEIEEIGDRVV